MITFVFGDSIAFGLWDSMGGWADRLKSYVLDEEIKSNIKNYHYIYNLGVDGNFTHDIIDRFENEVKARFWEGEKYSFIFATGINDTLFRNKSNYISTPQKYYSELKTLNTLAQEYSSNLCFIDLNPVNEDLTNPLKLSDSGECYTNQRIDVFNSTLYKFCEDNKANLIKISELFKKVNYKEFLVDGLHPNDKGHELIYKAVLPSLKIFLNG